MKNKTKHLNALKDQMDEVLKAHPEASMVEHRYRTLRGSLVKAYPNLITNTDKEVMIQFIHDIVHLDRALRRKTEGKQKLKKTILSKEYQQGLGYEANYKNNVSHLNKVC